VLNLPTYTKRRNSNRRPGLALRRCAGCSRGYDIQHSGLIECTNVPESHPRCSKSGWRGLGVSRASVTKGRNYYSHCSRSASTLCLDRAYCDTLVHRLLKEGNDRFSSDKRILLSRVVFIAALRGRRERCAQRYQGIIVILIARLTGPYRMFDPLT
jgi:hypothetical protein